MKTVIHPGETYVLTPPRDLVLSIDQKSYDDINTFISGIAHTHTFVTVSVIESGTWLFACILLNTGELGWLLIDARDNGFFKTYAKKVSHWRQ